MARVLALASSSHSDTVLLLRYFEMFVEQQGHDVETASDGPTGVQHARRLRRRRVGDFRQMAG